jgi:GNAT superfamily N-acetyltransferase
MHGQVSICKLSPADLGSACSVFETTIPDTLIKENIIIPYTFITKEVETKKRLLNESVENRDIIFLTAKIHGSVVGTISFGPCGEYIRKCTEGELSDIGELGSLYILPDHQGRGIGSALIREMAWELNGRGVERFCLDSGYKHAQKRWQRKFGEPYMTVKDYWGPGYDHMIWLCRVNDFI